MTRDTAPIETRFGTFGATDAGVVSLVAPLPGFEDCRRVVLLSNPEFAPFTCIQGLDAPRPSFLAISPQLVSAHYRMTLLPADREKLRADESSTLLWLALVRIETGERGDRAFVNLRAPIVINPDRMLGLQVVSADESDPIDHPIVVD